jgi:hypothetical protein
MINECLYTTVIKFVITVMYDIYDYIVDNVFLQMRFFRCTIHCTRYLGHMINFIYNILIHHKVYKVINT